MFNAKRLVPEALLMTALLTTSACAAGIYYPVRGPVVDRDDRVFYDRGLREGRLAGADDARRGRSYDLRRHDEYRDNRRGDDRGDVMAFRRGFEAGYDEAFRRSARGRYGDERPSYPPPPSYPEQRPRDNDRARERVVSPAREFGYRDGVEAGERAARSGARFDPVREKRYREGNHDYERRYGSLDEFKREYRDAFRQGYDAGYRGRR